jgi:hypothetical protein
VDRNDVVTVLGMGLLAGGLWMVYPPAALIVVGLALITFGIFGAWHKALTPNSSPEGRGERGKGTGK